MKLSTKIAYNTMIQVSSKIVSTILGLVVVAIMGRSLGASGYGEYTTIMTFLSFFAIVADLGLTLVTVQMISREDENENRILSNLFTLRLVSAIVFLGIAPFSVFLFPYPRVIQIGVLIVSLSFFFTALNQVLVGLFQKRLRMDKVSIADVVNRTILLIGVYIAVNSGYGLQGILIATVVSSFVSFLLHFIFSFSYAKIRLAWDFFLWKKIIAQSWPIAVTIVFNLIYLKTDTLILSLIKSEAEVGIYGAAYKVVDVLITMPFMFAGIILPILTSDWLKKEKEHFAKVFQRAFDFMIIAGVPLAVGTQFVASDLMALVAGPEFYVSGAVLKVLIVAVAMIFPGCMFSHAIIALDKQKKIIWAYAFVSFSSVIGYLLFIPAYSYIGAAWVTIYSETAIAIFAAYIMWKYSRVFPNFKMLKKSILSAIVMGGALYYFKSIFSSANLAVTIPLASLVYFSVLGISGGIKRSDLLELLSLK